MAKHGETNFPSGEAAKLFTTYGFPADLTRIMCEERGLKYDECAVDVSYFFFYYYCFVVF